MDSKEQALKLVNKMDGIKIELFKYLGGNKKAGRRARVQLLKLEKEGKLFRKLSNKD